MRSATKKSDGLFASLLLLPFGILFVMFFIYPVLHNLWISMTDYSGLKLKDYGFVGMQNFKEIFLSQLDGFLSMLVWTIVFACSVVALSFLLGAAIAVLLDKTKVGLARIYRGIFIIPWVIPSIITLLMWRGFLNTHDGLVNGLLNLFGLPDIPWLSDPLMAKISCILVMTWFSFPYFIIVVQGILKSIPKSLFEAAYLDGASELQSFFRITLPAVISSILPTLIMSFIMQFNQFGVYILTSGEPASEKLGSPGATDLLITYVFNTAFNNFRYDLAAAYAVIIFVFVAIFAYLAMKVGKKAVKGF